MQRLDELILCYTANDKVGNKETITTYLNTQSILRYLIYYTGMHLPFKKDINLLIDDLKEKNHQKITLRRNLYKAIIDEKYELAEKIKREINSISPSRSEGEEF